MPDFLTMLTGRAAGLLLSLAALLCTVSVQAQSVWFVDADATGSASGTSWADAFPDLQLALGAAEAGDEVWVAEGLYRPTSGSDRTISFVLTSGVALYGGFDGTEKNRDERDWMLYETTLSGNIGDPDSESDNSFHVITASDTSIDTILDGLSVAHGRADGVGPLDDRGGGIRLLQGDLTIRNAHLYRNDAYRGGGCLHVEDGSPLVTSSIFEDSRGEGGGAYFMASAPSIQNVVFRGESFGAVLFFAEGSIGSVLDSVVEGNDSAGIVIESSSPHLIRVIVRNNTVQSADGGGAIIRDGAAPIFEDAIFEGNTTSSGGGGSAVEIEGITAPLFIRTTFRGNVAGGSGAVRVTNASPVFLFCRFEQNIEFGSAALNALGSAITVLASTFIGNRSTWSASAGGGVLFTGGTFTGEPVVIASSLFVGNEANGGGAVAAFGVDADEAFLVNNTFVANEGRERGGSVYASNASGLQIQNSILWGNTAPDSPEVFVASGSPPMVAQSIVAGGYPSGTKILDADAEFVRTPDPGPDGQWGTPDDDYGDLRLQEGSPAVDYGLADYLPPDTWDLDGDGDTAEPLPVDLAGGPRQIGASPDLGAYEGAVRVANEAEAPEPSAHLAVWPNPATSGEIALSITVSSPGEIAVTLYDLLGRRVASRPAERLPAGVHDLSLDARGLARGTYLLQATIRSEVSGETSILMRPVTLR